MGRTRKQAVEEVAACVTGGWGGIGSETEDDQGSENATKGSRIRPFTASFGRAATSRSMYASFDG